MSGFHHDKKIIFFDIDGTLIPEGTNLIPESAQRAIQKARKNGHLMFVNTGRTLANMDDYIMNAGFDGYICACGSYILYKGKVLLYHHTEDEICQKVIELAEKYHQDIVFEAHHGLYYDKKRIFHEEAKALLSYLCGRYPTFDTYDPEALNFDKFVTWTRPDSDLPHFVQDIASCYDYIDRGGAFSEFVPTGFSKATGIQFILKHLSIPLENAYAIGDSNNDLPMLEYVPHSIAMGNSRPASLFDKVEFVTKSINDGGIEYALRHYGFID